MDKTPANYQEVIKNTDPATIAAWLQQDQKSCREKQLPSPLAKYLPPAPKDEFSRAVARQLSLHDNIPTPLSETRYRSIVGGIRAYLSQIHEITEEKEPWEEEQETAGVPTDDDLTATLKVLDYLDQEHVVLSASSALSDVRTAVQAQLAMEAGFRQAYHSASKTAITGALGRQRRCYICRHKITIQETSLNPALCVHCERFNHNYSQLSATGTFLTQRTALVTGGRIKLGFHTALRLLRLGAHVIVSTRYPRDAEARYAEQPDFHKWSSRLKIVGADFRTAADAFRLAQTVKDILTQWLSARAKDTGGPLDILINNAAQTLTDPVRSEVKAITREEHLLTQPQPRQLVINDGYQPRVRGGMQTPWMAGIEDRTRQQITDGEVPVTEKGIIQKGLGGERDEEEITKSSWTQSLPEIPYEDLISAHAVNAFVPFILCRELLPLMVNPEGRYDFQNLQVFPCKHIANVSSREGILENRTGSSSKRGHHVHTNMSKAAINMITETEAGPAWEQQGVCINTVDPGYMSAAPEMQHLGDCPLSFDDGAARVLYPVAMGYTKHIPIQGRFLKHFGAVEVIIRRG